MPRGYPTMNCKICDRHRDEVGSLSRRGKCQDCSVERAVSNAAQLMNHSGPWFDHWRRRGAAAYGAVLLDERSDAA